MKLTEIEMTIDVIRNKSKFMFYSDGIMMTNEMYFSVPVIVVKNGQEFRCENFECEIKLKNDGTCLYKPSTFILIDDYGEYYSADLRSIKEIQGINKEKLINDIQLNMKEELVQYRNIIK